MFASCRFGRVVSCIKEDLDDVVRRRLCESPVFTITLVASNINVTPVWIYVLMAIKRKEFYSDLDDQEIRFLLQSNT